MSSFFFFDLSNEFFLVPIVHISKGNYNFLVPIVHLSKGNYNLIDAYLISSLEYGCVKLAYDRRSKSI